MKRFNRKKYFLRLLREHIKNATCEKSERYNEIKCTNGDNTILVTRRLRIVTRRLRTRQLEIWISRERLIIYTIAFAVFDVSEGIENLVLTDRDAFLTILEKAELLDINIRVTPILILKSNNNKEVEEAIVKTPDGIILRVTYSERAPKYVKPLIGDLFLLSLKPRHTRIYEYENEHEANIDTIAEVL